MSQTGRTTGSAAPPPQPQSQSKMSSEIECIVIGAGISGLSAAKYLADRGVNVVVLEARDRVGGRTFTKRDPNVKYVDLGGAYVGPTQDYVLRMIKDLGLQTYKVNEVEDLVHYKDGRQTRFSADRAPPLRGMLAKLDLNNFFRTMDQVGETIPLDAPWDAPDAARLDSISFAQWINETAYTQAVKDFAKIYINVCVCSEPYEASALWFLWYNAQVGGTRRMFSTTNGGQERKIVGGSQQISEKLAAKLADRVRLNQPVVSIRQQTGGSTVTTLDGMQYRAKYIIMAIPPAIQGKIHYDPPLGFLRNQLIQRMPGGSVMKCIVYYKKAFWREKGYCGSMMIEGDDRFPLPLTMDDTKPDGSYPGIIGFILADKLRRLCTLTRDERRDLICRSFSKALDSEEALLPVHYEEFNWMSEQYSGGCYTAMCPPGLITNYGRILRQPVGRMFFASTETAIKWSGYMDGAISAGERAARQVLASQGKIPQDQVWNVKEPPSQDVPPLPFADSCFEKYAPSARAVAYLGYASLVVSGVAVAGLLLCKRGPQSS